MSEETPNRPDPRLQVGFTVVVEKDKEQAKATVVALTEAEIVVELLADRSGPQFEEEGRVRIKYWDESGIYFCSGEVLRASGTSLAISVYSEPVAMQRRGLARMATALPMSIRVTEASHQGLASQKIYQAETRNIGAGGVNFDTSLPLQPSDTLEVQIELPSESIGTAGEVVSAEKVLRDGKGVNSVGIEFFGLPAETSTIMEFLVENMPVPDSPE